MNQKSIVGGATALLLLLLAAWWMGWFHQEDELVAEIRELAAAPQNEGNRDAMRDVMRKQFENVPEDQRAAMFEKLAPIFIPMMMARFSADYDKFMTLSQADRNRELDKRIDQMMKNGGPGRGPGGGGGGGGGGRGNMDPKKMAEFQKKMLGWTTPEQRAKMDNGMQMFSDRMRERGMTPPSMPGGGFF